MRYNAVGCGEVRRGAEAPEMGGHWALALANAASSRGESAEKRRGESEQKTEGRVRKTEGKGERQRARHSRLQESESIIFITSLNDEQRKNVRRYTRKQ